MEKVFWIGDDGDNKSVCIDKTIFGRGDAIPAGDVTPERIKEWESKGLISRGDKIAPVVVRDTETVKALEAEIEKLKADLESLPKLYSAIVSLESDVESLPGLRREKKELQAALEKSKSGKKADKLKEMDERIKSKDKDLMECHNLTSEIEQDVAEKDALIKKQIERINELEKDLDDATAPAPVDGVGAGDDTAPEGGDETGGPQ